MKIYGHAIKAKAYVLAMIEPVTKISNNTIRVEVIEKIIAYGENLLEKPIELLDQRRKLHYSGLGKYFHHIELMSDNQEKIIRI